MSAGATREATLTGHQPAPTSRAAARAVTVQPMSDRPAITIPVFLEELDTGRYLDLARALEHQRALASRAESLVAACGLQLAKVPREVGGESQLMIARLWDLLQLAEVAAMEAVVACDRLARDVVGT